MAKSRKSTKATKTTGGDLLTWALHGIEQAIATARQRLSDLEAQARKLRSSSRGAAASTASDDAAEATPKKTARKKRKLSPEARKRIADAQKRRWAKARAAKE